MYIKVPHLYESFISSTDLFISQLSAKNTSYKYFWEAWMWHLLRLQIMTGENKMEMPHVTF